MTGGWKPLPDPETSARLARVEAERRAAADAHRVAALGCDYRRPLPVWQRCACGVDAICDAGKSPKENGTVSVLECFYNCIKGET